MPLTFLWTVWDGIVYKGHHLDDTMGDTMGLDLVPRIDYPGISLYRSTVPTVIFLCLGLRFHFAIYIL